MRARAIGTALCRRSAIASSPPSNAARRSRRSWRSIRSTRTRCAWSLNGEGDRGPMGIKSITTYLNDRDIRTRDGGRWGVASVHQILTRTTYVAQHRFNTRDHKTRTAKPEAEHAVMDVPPIITEAEFEAVQAALKARSPQWMPPRAVSGPTLLTGICFCASCGGAMTLRTGKGSAGGMYRYYTCSTKARQGQRGCRGLTVPMGKSRPAPAL